MVPRPFSSELTSSLYMECCAVFIKFHEHDAVEFWFCLNPADRS